MRHLRPPGREVDRLAPLPGAEGSRRDPPDRERPRAPHRVAPRGPRGPFPRAARQRRRRRYLTQANGFFHPARPHAAEATIDRPMSRRPVLLATALAALL